MNTSEDTKVQLLDIEYKHIRNEIGELRLILSTASVQEAAVQHRIATLSKRMEEISMLREVITGEPFGMLMKEWGSCGSWMDGLPDTW